MNKISELYDILYNAVPDCVFISESWLHADICDGLLDPKSEYVVLRKDRCGNRGGGVCALIARTLSVVPVIFPDKYSDLEIIGIDFVDFEPVLRMFVIYRPPYYDQKAVSYATLLFECLTEHSRNHKNMHAIIGDINLPHINWNILTGPDDDIHKTTLKFILEYGYSQLIDFPTRGCNLLDVLLTNVDMLITSITSHPPIGYSDHVTVQFSVAVNLVARTCITVESGTKCTYQWHNADFEGMSAYLNTVNWISVIHANPSAVCAWAQFCRLLQHAIDLFVPSFVASNSSKHSRKPRRPRAVRKCEMKKARLWKQLSKSPHDSLLRSKYRDCAYEWRQLVQQNVILTEERVVSANHLGAFYRYVYKRTANTSGIGVIMDSSGVAITNDCDKANAFNQFFSSVGVTDNNSMPCCNDVTLLSILDNIVISETEVIRSISKLRSNSSSGPDGLPPVLFKRLKYCLSYPLALLYNQLISVGALPPEWLTAYIVPVFKKGSAGDVSNYRPISFMCVPCKIIERIIAGKIFDHLYSNNILCSAQHGFVRRRSTCTNLMECFNDWTVCVQSRQQITIVYIDFSKAFDVVSHKKLFTRLYSYGVRGTVLLWLQNFLTGRTHQTKVGTSFSDIAALISGVVQGSGIGPLLFLIYINELAFILESHGIRIKLFADDVKLYIQIVDDVDVAQMQQAIDALVNWATEWQLSISVNKCCVLNVGRISHDTCLHINDNALPVVESTRDLGVLVSCDLSPSLHVSDIVAKAHKRSAAIHRAFVSRNIHLLVRAFTVYVRPLLEHDSVIWSPFTVHDIEAVESVQRRFTKRLPGLNSLSYPDRLKRINLHSLELRRLYTDL